MIFPVGNIERLQITPQSPEKSDETPLLQLTNSDQLVGTLAGELKLDTAFDTITLEAAEIRSIQHLKEASSDLQVTLWDQSVLSGQLQEPTVRCDLLSGVQVNVPASLIDKYNQPQPRASKEIIERIKQIVTELNADDWKQRDRAEQQLVTMGPVVTSTLKDLRGRNPPKPSSGSIQSCDN